MCLVGLSISALLFFLLRSKPLPPSPPPVFKIPVEAEKEGVKGKGKPPAPHIRMALVVDDGGYSVEKIKVFAGIGKPITFAVLPNTPHARKVAVLVHESGGQVLLHLPMEPKEGDQSPLEDDTVMVGMSRSEIQRIVRKDLAQVPHVRGLNNHMGSKATEDPSVMKALMDVLKTEGLFYIDSHTSPHSAGLQAAREAGVPFGSNDRFIDHDQELEAIKHAIRLAMKRARQEGRAIAIGHPNPSTAQAIREMVPEIEKSGIKLVFASEVVG